MKTSKFPWLTGLDPCGRHIGHNGIEDDGPDDSFAGLERIGEDRFRYEVVVQSPMGLHARPAAQLVQLAGKFDCAVRIVKDAAVVDGKSILQILSLAAAAGTLLTIETQGQDGLAAISALAGLMMGINKEEGETA